MERRAHDRGGGTAGSTALVHDARALASALPDLLVEALNVAGTIVSGWHGRRRPGPGETFWQFRPYFDGESTARIDWRRSAREDLLYVREQEWEAAHTVWLWPDLSTSMDFRSDLAPVTKRDRTVVLTLALADLLARGGERVGLLGGGPPIASRNAAERIARRLVDPAADRRRPSLAGLKRFSDVIVIGDLLDPLDEITGQLGAIAKEGASVQLVQVLDPIEETFPFAGRTEFRDPETGLRLTAGRAEGWRDDYCRRLNAHRETLSAFADHLGWTFLLHHTDRPASEPLFLLHARLSEGIAPGPARPLAGGGP